MNLLPPPLLPQAEIQNKKELQLSFHAIFLNRIVFKWSLLSFRLLQYWYTYMFSVITKHVN